MKLQSFIRRWCNLKNFLLVGYLPIKDYHKYCLEKLFLQQLSFYSPAPSYRKCLEQKKRWIVKNRFREMTIDKCIVFVWYETESKCLYVESGDTQTYCYHSIQTINRIVIVGVCVLRVKALLYHRALNCSKICTLLFDMFRSYWW